MRCIICALISLFCSSNNILISFTWTVLSIWYTMFTIIIISINSKCTTITTNISLIHRISIIICTFICTYFILWILIRIITLINTILILNIQFTTIFNTFNWISLNLILIIYLFTILNFNINFFSIYFSFIEILNIINSCTC